MEKSTAQSVKEELEETLRAYFGMTAKEAGAARMFTAAALSVKKRLMVQKAAFDAAVKEEGKRRVYYLSMEFLLGKSLLQHLENLNLTAAYRGAFSALGYSLEEVLSEEVDAGLGNGGLGRLAACFFSALTAGEYPAMGYSICYEYGLFRQLMVEGSQVELPDVWLPRDAVWLTKREDEVCRVRFGGRVRERWEDNRLKVEYEDFEEVEALPLDMEISGGESRGVSTLRLWKARDVRHFDMGLFAAGQYGNAMRPAVNAAIITKVLYPSDNHTEGKILRLTQQYFLVSATAQNILRAHLKKGFTPQTLSETAAIHINDTHPAMVIPELMRLLMDEHGLSFSAAFQTVKETVTYTNHTVMPEALETWDAALFQKRLPRIYAILEELDRRFLLEVQKDTYLSTRVEEMRIISGGRVRMAPLALMGSHKVNGVSRLHSDILKHRVFADFYTMEPQKFESVTNGIDHRRWLLAANPALSSLLDEVIGRAYHQNPLALQALADHSGEGEVLAALAAVKRKNKERFAAWLLEKSGESISPETLFDVQVKRLHEYKRQLMNALLIIDRCFMWRDEPRGNFLPRTYLFGAKAAPGYDLAKRIITLISLMAKEIERDGALRGKVKVVFLENYSVSMAELLLPAAEVSEQISLAGKEASGTGCMKMMMNGALTVGTRDGANPEMEEAVGRENIFLFGKTAKEVAALCHEGYAPARLAAANPRIARVLERLRFGFCGESFGDIADYLVGGAAPDPYFCLADFEAYRKAEAAAEEAYRDKSRWNRMSLLNIAASGYFAAARSVREYAERIWRIEPLKQPCT